MKNTDQMERSVFVNVFGNSGICHFPKDFFFLSPQMFLNSIFSPILALSLSHVDYWFQKSDTEHVLPLRHMKPDATVGGKCHLASSAYEPTDSHDWLVSQGTKDYAPPTKTAWPLLLPCIKATASCDIIRIRTCGLLTIEQTHDLFRHYLISFWGGPV